MPSPPAGPAGAGRWQPPGIEPVAPSGLKAKAEANLEALRVLRDLETNDRDATPTEQETLARWSGWGAIPGVFDDSDDSWTTQRQALHELVDEDEWSEARRTVLNAHYTDPAVVAAIWHALDRLGFKGGRVLEPGCGSGNFIAHAPAEARMVGIERDRVTAAMAQYLFPDAVIHATPFERFETNRPFDVAVGNVPFAKVVPHDARYNRARLTLHNFFLAKSLELLRPGALLVALTSRYTLDARNPAARRALAANGDLVGALRLPSASMRKVAGTEAILDLLVLRRRDPEQEPAHVGDWERTVEIEVPDNTTGEVGTLWTNQYLAEHPDHVLGTPMLDRAMYRTGDLVVRGDYDSLYELVARGLDSIIDDTTIRYQPPTATPTVQTTTKSIEPVRVGDVDLAGDRRVALRHRSFAVSTSGRIYQHQGDELVPAEVPRKSRDEVKALVGLRDHTVNLLRLESDDAEPDEIETARETLATDYRAYVDRYGALNRVSWARTGRTDPKTGEEKRRRIPAKLGGFRHDPEWPTLAAIEVYDDETDTADPAPIQQRRVIHPPQRRLGADTPQEAIAICLDETGTLDVDRIAELLGVELEAAAAEIEPHTFTDPDTANLVPAEDYLSGDVRHKLQTAQQAAQRDHRYQRNVQALAEVQPTEIHPGEILVRPGVPWVPIRDVEAFMREVLDCFDADVTYTGALGVWSVDVPRWARPDWVRDSSGFGTRRMAAYRLFDACLNQRLVRIYDQVDERSVLNVAATTEAREKQEQISEAFSKWVWEDPERAERLAQHYNRVFNSYRAPEYSGDHLTFPGLAATFTPHQHQRSAVARTLRDGRCLLAHSVGAGKTATMVMAATELKRLGSINKPAVVVPNHMLEQFSREWLQLYPQARLLITTKDLTGPTGRKEFVARAATGDWDGVVITHSAFERLPMRVETYDAYITERTEALHVALTDAHMQPGNNRRLIKRIEAAIAREEARMQRLVDAASKDDGVSFEDTGIDLLAIDELHLFKNKAVVTAVEGVASTGSKRATDLDAKLWYLHRAQGARSLIAATATPIANSIAEAWVMQTYLQPDILAESGMDRFDAWAATFGQQIAAVELAPDGGSYRVASRLARYQNVPELIAQFRRTTDIRVNDDLDLKLPATKDNCAEVVVVPASDRLKSYVQDLVARAEDVRNNKVEPDEDNMLKITSDGRHAALDLRLVGRTPDPDGGKIAAAAERIADIYRQTRDLEYLDEAGNPSPRPGGFQLVFCDLSTPKDNGEWNAYDELKGRLIAHGVPEGEVAFVHDANNDEARAQLFARCRNGQIAVLVGSTAKMGVGTNIHTRAVALTHLDCPWRPADIEQREGRILRQGNQNTEVQIFRYATEASFDVYMWQTVERKGTFIHQLMRGENIGRDLDDVGDAVLSYAEVKALASGNPLVIEQAGVQADLTKYERLEFAHQQEQAELEGTARTRRNNAASFRKRATALEQALEQRVDTSGDRFQMQIRGAHHATRAGANERLRELIDATLRGLDHDPDTSHAKFDFGRSVARIGGFDVTVAGHRLNRTKQITVTLCLGEPADHEIRLEKGDLADTSLDVVARLEHPLRRLDERRVDAVARAEELEAEADTLQARVGQPFPYSERLAELRRRHQDILDQLDEQTGNNSPDAIIDHDGTTPAPPGGPPPTNPTERLDRLTNPPPPDDNQSPGPGVDGPGF